MHPRLKVVLLLATFVVGQQNEVPQNEEQSKKAYDDLLRKAESPAQPKGIPFPQIPGPKCKDSK